MLGIIMTAHKAKCRNCGEQVSGEIYHLGFSDMQALYCSSCPKVLLLKDFKLFERNEIKWLNLKASDPGFQYFDRHLLPVFKQIEDLFRRCSCGGYYGYMNPPRCPKCNGLFLGDIYEDKPVLKSRDKYVFVTAGSVNDAEQIKDG